jgi:hypothetical protein
VSGADLTYVYCLVEHARRPLLRSFPAGIGGGAVRTLDAGGGIRAVVSSVPAESYDEGALARGLQDLDWVGRAAVAHETVVEHFLRAPAVLPMQLFTLFTSDARALEHVQRERTRIERILADVAGQIEWGLRLTFDARAAIDASTSVTTDGRSGAAYLARKRDLLDVTKARVLAAKREADRLFRIMSREATDTRRRTALERTAPGARLLLDAAFLVPRQRSAAFRAALRRHARTLGAGGITVSLTGPWPPYNFITSRVRRKAAGTRKTTDAAKTTRTIRRTQGRRSRTAASESRRKRTTR